MKSFDDNLESLDIAPRFLDLSTLTQLRRDSSTNRSKRDSSCIFLEKRERLESGDFGAFSHDSHLKKEYANTFYQPNPNEKSEIWGPLLPNVVDPVENVIESGEIPVNGKTAKHIEEESVIDHHLTIEKIEKPFVAVLQAPEETPLVEEPVREEPKFLIKVKKTDMKITLSAPDSERFIADDVSEQEVIFEDMPEDRGNNMIFADEPGRLKAKVSKVVHYWKKASLLIPNVFRALRLNDDDRDSYMEFQDYSRKELLVQSNGTKFRSNADRDKSKNGLKKVKRMSGANVDKGMRVRS